MSVEDKLKKCNELIDSLSQEDKIALVIEARKKELAWICTNLTEQLERVGKRYFYDGGAREWVTPYDYINQMRTSLDQLEKVWKDLDILENYRGDNCVR